MCHTTTVRISIIYRLVCLETCEMIFCERERGDSAAAARIGLILFEQVEQVVTPVNVDVCYHRVEMQI